MITVFKVHSDDPTEVVEHLRHMADTIEKEGRVFTGEIFDPLRVLMGKKTTLVEISKEEE